MKISAQKKLRPVKCPKCSKQIDRNVEPYEKYNSRYYHPECLKEVAESTQHRRDLINYICELHGIDKPTGQILRQIKNYEEKHGYTLKGIELTLRYFHEIKEQPVIEGAGIGIVEIFYDEARKYYTNLARLYQHNASVQIDNREDIVYSRPPKPKKKKTIDIGGI